MENKRDKIFGSILGAFVGDALGCTLEFSFQVKENQIEDCLKMPGGGPFKLKPGQITDDSELATSLLLAIVEGKGSFDVNLMKKYYIQWLKSNPLDVGNTTKNALFLMLRNITNEKLYESVYFCNKQSQSNGGLMRITPLSCFFHNLNKESYIENIIKITKLEQSLTHPNEISIEAGIIYNIAIYNFLNNNSLENTFEIINNYVNTTKNKEIKKWWDLIENNKPFNSQRIGHVKIAFTYSFYLLKNKFSFNDAMKELLKIGGDTDTNLAIAGGLLGSYYGLKDINKDWVEKVLKSDYDRPEFWVPKKNNLTNLIDELIKISPKDNIEVINYK